MDHNDTHWHWSAQKAKRYGRLPYSPSLAWNNDDIPTDARASYSTSITFRNNKALYFVSSPSPLDGHSHSHGEFRVPQPNNNNTNQRTNSAMHCIDLL